MWATTAQLYPARDQWHMTKNQPIEVLILLSESLAVYQINLFNNVEKIPTSNKESDEVIKQFFIVQISVFIYRLEDITENI